MQNAFLFILGTIIGSFFYAFIDRLHDKESISDGRSKCDSCKHELSWKDLIPVLSYIFLGGKCRYCKRKISHENIITELVYGIFFGLSLTLWPYSTETLSEITHFSSWLAVCSILIAISIYDLKWMLIPDRLQFLLASSTVVFILSEHVATGTLLSGGIVQSAAGLATLFLLFLSIHRFSKGKWLGGADVYLIAPIGAILGLKYGVMSVLISSYIALLLYGSLRFFGNKSKQMPFGPALSIACIITYLYGKQLFDLIT